MKERIKLLRNILGLTQQKFADRLGIKGNTISQYESGRNAPVDAVISLICREFNVSEAWLRTGEGEMFKPENDNAINRLCEEMNATELEAGILRAYFSIDPKIRNTFMRCLIQEVSADYSISTPKLAEASAGEIVPPGYSSREEMEAEVEKEVELFRQQRLSEKLRESQAPSVNGSGAG